MLPAENKAAPVARRQLACNVALEDDSPILHVVESFASPGEGITLRKYALHSVDDDPSHALSPRATSGEVPAYYYVVLLKCPC